MNELLLTPAQVARSLGVTSTTIVNWCEIGRINYSLTIGGHRRISTEELSRVQNQMGKQLLHKPAPVQHKDDCQGKLTVSQAAAYLGVTDKSVVRYANDGKLNPIRNNFNWRMFDKKDLDNFQADRQKRIEYANTAATAETTAAMTVQVGLEKVRRIKTLIQQYLQWAEETEAKLEATHE